MKLDGQLERAQLEELSSADPTPRPRSRIYSDITDTTKPTPRFYDGFNYVPVKLRKENYLSATSAHSMAVTTEILSCDATISTFPVALPSAAAMPGQTALLRKTDSTFNVVTIAGSGGQLIDGAASILLSTMGEWVRLLSLGTSWTVIGSGYYQGKVAYTPTGSWVANTTYTGFWWRTGSRMNVEVKAATTGAPTAASLTVTLPVGPLADTASLASSTSAVSPLAGNVACVDSGVENYLGTPHYFSTSAIVPMKDDGDGTFSVINATAPFTFAAGDSVQITALDIPIVGWRG